MLTKLGNIPLVQQRVGQVVISALMCSCVMPAWKSSADIHRMFNGFLAELFCLIAFPRCCCDVPACTVATSLTLTVTAEL